MNLEISNVNKNKLAHEFRTFGWAFLAGSEIFMNVTVRQQIKEFQLDLLCCPKDNYCSNGTRYRRYSNFHFDPVKNHLEQNKKLEYIQKTSLNPMDGGMRRIFSGLNDSIRSKIGFITHLTVFNYNLIRLYDKNLVNAKFEVGFHMIAYRPEINCISNSSPPRLHKDGEPFTFIHLLLNENIDGGTSIIANNNKNNLSRINMFTPMDTLLFADDRVYHGVESMKLGKSKKTGLRGIIIIDFTPI